MKLRVVLVALLSACLVLMASSPQTTIKVSVKNQFDKPVENAAVILDFLGSHQITKLGKRKPIHWEVHTNLEGLAHFPPVPQGTDSVAGYYEAVSDVWSEVRCRYGRQDSSTLNSIRRKNNTVRIRR